MGCTSSKEAVQEPKKPFSHPPPTPHPNAHKHHQAHTDLIEEKNDSTQVKPEEIVKLPEELKSVPKIEEPTSSVPHPKPPTVTVTHTNNSATTTSTATTSAVKRGSLRMIVEDTEEKFQMKSSNNSNPNIKKEDDSFQPYPGYVIKLRSLNPSYEYDKIFFNIFHHELFNSYPNEFILSKENYIIYDNRNKECLAYNILLPSNHFQLMESDSDEKEKTLLKLIYFINQKNPTARLENTSIKFPKTTKGYVGNDIPFFIIPMARKTSPKANSTATPTPTPAPTTVKLADIRAPTPPATVITPEEEVKPVVAEVKTAPEEVVAPKGISIATISKPVNVPVSSPPSPVTIAAPPKMVGWLRKRGHVVQNWKTRYFVLDNGFLTYYVDKLDLPPYGKTMKGQLCLAGYRDAAIIENGKINEEKQKEYEEQRLTFFSEGGNSKQAPQNRRKSTGMFTSEPLLRIHLMFIKGIVNEGNVEDLRNTLSQRNNNGKKGGEDEEGGNSGTYEFMMEASNLEEKYAWLAAIEAHTAYIESVANSGNFSVEQFPYGDSDVIASSNNNNNSSDRQLSASPPPQGRPVGGSNSPSNLTPIGSFSVAPSESDRVKRSSVEVPMNANSGGGGGRRTSVINVSAVNQKWKIFIQKGEELVTNGLTGKPNPIGIQLIREIILVKSPAVTLSPEEAVLYPNSKRLIYIDANSFELKGEIKWIAGEKMPTIKKINDTCFDIIDSKNKSYRFYPKDEKTVDEWIEIINNTPPN